ncbi:MAG: phosphate ABC transporter permease PstA [Actinomycetia bacterium]|nr:phosphate ABC transporter permease PstA [Actinomycetes bacterium]
MTILEKSDSVGDQVGNVESQRPKTTLPQISPIALPPSNTRRIAGISREDLGNILGAGASAIAVTFLLFGLLAPLQGSVGFVVVTFLVFLGLYALLVSLTNPTPIVIDKVMTAILAASAALALAALASVVAFTLWRGRDALVTWNLYTEDMSEAGPADPLSVGGIQHSIIGTLIIIAIAIVLTVPLGIACAVFLNETRGRFNRLVRTVVDAMSALPSILAGLFIFATFILILGLPRSGLAAALAVSIMMLPIIIRSADVVIRLVPGNLREASASLGAPERRTVWHVVLPTARPGLGTAVILGVARGIGETAPVLLTSGFASTLNVNPLRDPMVSLPLSVFEFVQSPQPALIARGFATAAVLMVLVLVLFAVARLIGGRPAGQLSSRQRKRAESRSLRDLKRIEPDIETEQS